MVICPVNMKKDKRHVFFLVRFYFFIIFKSIRDVYAGKTALYFICYIFWTIDTNSRLVGFSA